jgi:hypothetical protein
LVKKKLESGAVIGQKQVKHEREPKEQEIPILDMFKNIKKLSTPKLS